MLLGDDTYERVWDRMQRVEAEYLAVLAAYDAATADDDERALYERIRALQREYKALARQLRPLNGEPWRERITLVPGRCMAATRRDRQCSRRATYRVGDLCVCTQHYNLIEFGTGSYPDLFDADGYGFAGHGVIKTIPRPLFWEEYDAAEAADR